LGEVFEMAWGDLADSCGLPVDVVWPAYPDRDGILKASFRFDEETRQTVHLQFPRRR
jgi:hypothetical protein